MNCVLVSFVDAAKQTAKTTSRKETRQKKWASKETTACQNLSLQSSVVIVH